MKVYEAVAKTLHELGVDRIFGYVGGANVPYLAAFEQAHQGSYVAATHESGAVSMADGWSRISGRPGIASTTTGPGLMNGLTSLTAAARSGSSLVLLTGSAPQRSKATPPHRPHVQWLDLRAAAKLAGVAYREVKSPMSVSNDVANAVRTASVLHRPVLVDIPQSILSSEAGPIAASCGFGPWTTPRSAPDDDALDAALGVIASANRPVIVAGGGALLSGARSEVYEMATALHAPLTTTVPNLHFCADYPLQLGIFGMTSHSLAAKFISQADCIRARGAIR